MAGIFDESIEIYHLLSQPFLAAIEADREMAKTTLKFIKELGFEQNGSSAHDDTKIYNLGKPLMLSFDYESQLTDYDSDKLTNTVSKNVFKAPLLSLVNTPSLRVQSVEVDLTLEISKVTNEETTIESTTTGSTTTGSTTTGSTTTDPVSTRSITTNHKPNPYKFLGKITNDTSKNTNYKVKMVAENVGNTEALDNLMKLLTNSSNQIVESSFTKMNVSIAINENDTDKFVDVIIDETIELKPEDKLVIEILNNHSEPITSDFNYKQFKIKGTQGSNEILITKDNDKLTSKTTYAYNDLNPQNSQEIIKINKISLQYLKTITEKNIMLSLKNADNLIISKSDIKLI